MSDSKKSKYLLIGAKEIAEAIGENKGSIKGLVQTEGLPAWKRGDKGPWRAHPEDIANWVRKQSDKYCKTQGIYDGNTEA